MSVISRVVRPLSGRTDAAPTLAETTGRAWDYAIGGQTFLSAASDDRPLIRVSAPIRKDQFDTEAEPGEQSLEGWWLRSQESFHKGAGVLYQESRVEIDPGERFRESMGVDVWTPGRVSLLPATAVLQAGPSTTLLAQGTDGTTDVVFQASGSTLYRITASGSTAVTWGGSGTITSVEVWDGYYYVTDSTGVWRGPISGGAGAKLWNLSTPGSVAYRRAGGYALLLVDNRCYDVTDEATAPTLPAAFFTLKETGWRWSAAAVANGRVVAAGQAGGQAAIWTFTPTISATGWTFAQSGGGLPRGETVHALANYYNTYLALGTSRGVRFAVYGENGQFTFGPLTYESTNPVRGIKTIGRWVYAAVENEMPDGTSGLIRVDPETELADGRFAWANDLSSGTTGTTGAVADLGGRPVFCVASAGSYVAHATDLVLTGYLTTGRIRFRTLEPKLFKYLRVRTDAMAGSVAVSAVTDNDSLAPVVTYSEAGATDHDEAALPQVLGPVESLALRFTLTRATATTGPVLRSYQIKALPAPRRQRVYRLPLSLFDVEKTWTGATHGYSGFAADRLRALEAMEEAGDLVVFQDFVTGESRLAVVDEVEFRQTAPPGRSGWGGFVYVTVRSVD